MGRSDAPHLSRGVGASGVAGVQVGGIRQGTPSCLRDVLAGGGSACREKEVVKNKFYVAFRVLLSAYAGVIECWGTASLCQSAWGFTGTVWTDPRTGHVQRAEEAFKKATIYQPLNEKT